MTGYFCYILLMNEQPNNNERLDWSETLRQYEVPSVFKERLLRPYFEKADLKEPILDAGCGTGYFSKILNSRGLKVTGIDLNGQLESNDSFDFKQADITAFETDKKFETILLINILATAPPAERLKMLQKIKELKTEGGLAYVVNTNAELFGEDFEADNLSSRQLGDGKARVKVKLIDGQIIEFTDYLVGDEEIRKMCAATGLEIIEKKDFKPDELKKPIYNLYLVK